MLSTHPTTSTRVHRSKQRAVIAPLAFPIAIWFERPHRSETGIKRYAVSPDSFRGESVILQKFFLDLGVATQLVVRINHPTPDC